MKVNQWLAVNKNGITKVRKSKPYLDFDEIAIKIKLEIPDELFQRPSIEATITVQDIPNTSIDPSIIINTKELIEQQTGARIDFRVIEDENKENQ
jgi:hypothetical protein